MSRTLHRIVLLTALVAACSRTDARAAPGSTGAAKTTSCAAGTPASANGAVASTPTAAPHDSISDRADRGRILGDSTASVWVIMASDFQCPYCKQWHDAAFQQVLKNYVNTGRVRLAFLNMPLSIHPNAVPAAEAAMCASVQNKFWPVHEALFATQAQWERLPSTDSVFAGIVAKTGVDMTAWHECVTQHSTLALIQADHDRATTARVNSTPTFFVGSQVLVGWDANVPAAIDAALKANGAKKPPAS